MTQMESEKFVRNIPQEVGKLTNATLRWVKDADSNGVQWIAENIVNMPIWAPRSGRSELTRAINDRAEKLGVQVTFMPITAKSGETITFTHDEVVKLYDTPKVFAGIESVEEIPHDFTATPEAMQRGLEDSAAGRIKDLGDFTQYANDIDEDEVDDIEDEDSPQIRVDRTAVNIANAFGVKPADIGIIESEEITDDPGRTVKIYYVDDYNDFEITEHTHVTDVRISDEGFLVIDTDEGQTVYPDPTVIHHWVDSNPPIAEPVNVHENVIEFVENFIKEYQDSTGIICSIKGQGMFSGGYVASAFTALLNGLYDGGSK